MYLSELLTEEGTSFFVKKDGVLCGPFFFTLPKNEEDCEADSLMDYLKTPEGLFGEDVHDLTGILVPLSIEEAVGRVRIQTIVDCAVLGEMVFPLTLKGAEYADSFLDTPIYSQMNLKTLRWSSLHAMETYLRASYS